jgi:hypothetical protein
MIELINHRPGGNSIWNPLQDIVGAGSYSNTIRQIVGENTPILPLLIVSQFSSFNRSRREQYLTPICSYGNNNLTLNSANMGKASVWKDATEQTSFAPLTQDISVDVVIIGGGITGITAAYNLSKAAKQ